MRTKKSVYGSPRRALGGIAVGLAALLAAGSALAPRPVLAQGIEATVIDARDALRRKDRVRLAADRATAATERNPLAMWVDYWELANRLGDARQDELDAFAARWRGTYVEDRLRNDWLLELGRRRDWTNFAAEFPRFRMNDDREVTCYALLVDHLAGKDVRAATRSMPGSPSAMADDGCALMAATLLDAKKLTPADVLAQGPPRDRRRPAARRPPGGPAAGEPSAGKRHRRRDRQPGALPRAQGQRAAADRRRADDAGADAHGLHRSRRRRRAAHAGVGSACCRRIWRPGPGRALASRRRSSCSPTLPTTSSALPGGRARRRADRLAR